MEILIGLREEMEYEFKRHKRNRCGIISYFQGIISRDLENMHKRIQSISNPLAVLIVESAQFWYEQDTLQILVSLKIIFAKNSDGFNMVWVIDLR